MLLKVLMVSCGDQPLSVVVQRQLRVNVFT